MKTLLSFWNFFLGTVNEHSDANAWQSVNIRSKLIIDGNKTLIKNKRFALRSGSMLNNGAIIIITIKMLSILPTPRAIINDTQFFT